MSAVTPCRWAVTLPSRLSNTLANPWHLEVQETKRPPHPLPAGTSIVQVYDESESDLLILGEPGAGKTTLLLELAISERMYHIASTGAK
jgi:hypothetical protein